MKYLEFETPASKQAAELASDYKLSNHGLISLDRVFWNLPSSALYEEAIFRGEAHMSDGGPLVVHTGKWTARAANDKYIVSESENNENVWWGVTIANFLPINSAYYSLAFRHFSKEKNYSCKTATQVPTPTINYPLELLQLMHGKVCSQEICSSCQNHATNINDIYQNLQ